MPSPPFGLRYASITAVQSPCIGCATLTNINCVQVINLAREPRWGRVRNALSNMVKFLTLPQLICDFYCCRTSSVLERTRIYLGSMLSLLCMAWSGLQKTQVISRHQLVANTTPQTLWSMLQRVARRILDTTLTPTYPCKT